MNELFVLFVNLINCNQHN